MKSKLKNLLLLFGVLISGFQAAQGSDPMAPIDNQQRKLDAALNAAVVLRQVNLSPGEYQDYLESIAQKIASHYSQGPARTLAERYLMSFVEKTRRGGRPRQSNVQKFKALSEKEKAKLKLALLTLSALAQNTPPSGEESRKASHGGYAARVCKAMLGALDKSGP